MKISVFARRGALLGFVALVVPTAGQACSSCGCTLGTEWANEGYSTDAGLRVDLRYDFINQDQLRKGGHEVDAGSLEFPNEDEIQKGTLTRFYTLGLDYSFDRDWGVSVSVPYLTRDHQTIAEGDTDVSTSHSSGIGDVRVVARYQGFFEDRSWGLQFGLKLPTGQDDLNFASGPQQGELVDRGLQSGTGTTDAIIGVYNYAALSREWDRFEQVQIKQPLASKDGFRPSTQYTANAGIRYVGLPKLIPQLQLNGRIENHETGSEADFPNSGSQVVDISPGLTGKLTGRLAAYGFVQLPVYQHYTGYQLAPHYTVTAGLTYRF